MSISSLGANLIRSETVNGTTEQIWETSSLREEGAIQKVKATARIKGLTNITVNNVREVGSGRLPGQTVFRITIEAPR